MRLYFIDGCDTEVNKLKTVNMTKVCRGSGYTANQVVLVELHNHAVQDVISNDESLLGNELFWSTKLNEYEVFIWKNHEWKNINLLTNKEIHKGHNIRNMYITGAFN